jgi:rare lipoprotein A
MMLRTLVFFMLFLPGLTDAASTVDRDDLTDDQLLEVLAQDSGTTTDPRIGVATYYASRFIGRRTTSGQRYHPDKLTAAHALLPLGTIATVENFKSGQKVSVIINDRCHPRHAARNLIDLSRAAAQQIDLWGKGVIKVKIVPIEKKHPLDDLLDGAKE